MLTKTNLRIKGVPVDSGLIVIADKDHYKDYNPNFKISSYLFLKKTFAPGTYKIKAVINKSWNGRVIKESTVEITSGTLYVCDPCYLIQKVNTLDWAEYFENYKSGKHNDVLILDSMGGDGLYDVELEIIPIKIKLKTNNKTEKEQNKMSIKKVSNLQAYILIKNSKGKIFGVTFKKTDGSIRHMTCRLGVKKYLTGKGMSWNPELREKLSVFDTQKNEYRMINLDSLMGLTLNGQEYLVGSTALADYLASKAKQTQKTGTLNGAVKWSAEAVISKASEIAKILNQSTKV